MYTKISSCGTDGRMESAMTHECVTGRREFLRYAAGSAAWLAASGALLDSFAGEVRAASLKSSEPDLILALTASRSETQLLSGKPTGVWRFSARVLKGDGASVQPSPGGYLGPTLRLKKGQRVRIEFNNQLADPAIVHWHGLHLPEAMDGHPRYAVGPGKRYVYEFQVINRAGSYWYHPHTHGITGRQIYMGLAGMLLVSDEEEQGLRLPQGESDLPIVLQDRTFGRDNQLAYISEEGDGGRAGSGMMGGGGVMGGGMMGRGMMGGSIRGGMMGMMSEMMGFLGDEIFVNGRRDAVFPVASRAYRLRLLNASNSRIYRLAWGDGTPLTIIATDGGLLERPERRAAVTLAPGERIDLFADFSDRSVGATLAMRSLAFEDPMGGMMGGMMRQGKLPSGAAFDVFRIRVDRRDGRSARLPERLSALPPPKEEETVNFGSPRPFRLTMGMMRWGINGRTFDMDGVADDEIVKLGTSEVWEFANDTSRMMAMPHSMHLHGAQFRVLDRTSSGRQTELRESIVDAGLKDTVLVLPGERVKILAPFSRYAGLFPYHCHMLEHGDAGMMRNYSVRA